jgi:VanZ family protein
MSEPTAPVRIWLVTAIMAAFILYGSLYPFKFSIPPHGPGPLVTLLSSWDTRPGRADFIANILLYMPFGYFFLLGFRRGPYLAAILVLAVCLGAVLSLGVELTQYYDAGRDTQASDFYANTLGTFMGGLAAVVIGAKVRSPLLNEVAGEPIPALLVFAWASYRLYPFVPTINAHKYWNALGPILRAPSIDAYDLARQTAIWLTLYALIDAVVRGRKSIHLMSLFVLAVICGKILIISLNIRMAELAGAAVALVIWMLLLKLRPSVRAGIAGVVLCGYVIVSRFEPFRFQSVRRPFGWVPFHSFMFGSLMVDTLSFLEKFFLYGSVVYLLGFAAGRRWAVTLSVAAVIFATSWVQTFLPDRSAEITDGLMVLIIGLVFATIPSEDAAATTQDSDAAVVPCTSGTGALQD